MKRANPPMQRRDALTVLARQRLSRPAWEYLSIGRPYLWGLAVDGAAGVQRVIELLRAELEAAMALCGATSLDRITREHVWPNR